MLRLGVKVKRLRKQIVKKSKILATIGCWSTKLLKLALIVCN